MKKPKNKFNVLKLLSIFLSSFLAFTIISLATTYHTDYVETGNVTVTDGFFVNETAITNQASCTVSLDGTGQYEDIQSCIDFLNISNGGTIYIKNGTYTIPRTNLTDNITIIMDKGTIIECSDSTYCFYGLNIENTEIRGGSFDLVDGTDYAVYFENSRHVKVNDIYAYNMDLKAIRFENCNFTEAGFNRLDVNGANMGIQVENGIGAKVHDNTLYGESDFFMINLIANDSIVSRNKLNGAGNGSTLFGSDSNAYLGINVGYHTSPTIFNVKVSDNIIKNVEDMGIWITNVRASSFEGNIVDTTTQSAGGISCRSCREVNVDNNIIKNVYHTGISFGAHMNYANESIIDCHISDNLIYNPNVEGSTGYQGIILRRGSVGTCGNNTVSGNHIVIRDGWVEYGIVTSSCSNFSNYVSGNYITGNVSVVNYRVGSKDILQNNYPEGTHNASFLQKDLIGFWGFDYNSGSVAWDSSRTNATGKLYGSNTWTWGVSGSAIDFNGTHDYVLNISPSPLPQNYSEFTLSAWFNSHDTLPTTYAIIFSEGYDYANGITLALANSNVFYVALRNKTGSASGQTFSSWTADEWTHITIVYNNDELKAYKNGEWVSTEDYSNYNDISCTRTTFGIGGKIYNPPSWEFNGTIDEVRFYNRTLSESEIRALYLGLGATATGHLALK